MEADLLGMGITLEELGERVSWRAVIAFAKHAGPGTALYRVSNGRDSAWSLDSQLLALIVDVLSVANYQRGGGKGSKPKPIQRPGVKNETSTKWGGAAVAAGSFDDFWGEAV